jgi:YidC/Oxa1 family membrane protein insertase
VGLHRRISDGRVLGTNGSWVLAVVFLAVTVRVILFPVFVKQIKSQRAMQALQIPVFLGLFHVLRRLSPTKELTTLYGWTDSLFHSASAASLFTAPISSKFGSSAAELAALEANGTTVKVIAGQ